MKKELTEISGFENAGQYTIYDDGRLFSHKSNNFLKPLKDTKGYYYYDLRYQKCKYKCPKVHRLVMMAFSNDKPKEQINHIDGNKENNHISNLEWINNQENRIHALRKGLKKEIDYGIDQYDLKGNYIRHFNTCREALVYMGKPKENSGNIGRVVKGYRKTAYGYIWKKCESSTTSRKAYTQASGNGEQL